GRRPGPARTTAGGRPGDRRPVRGRRRRGRETGRGPTGPPPPADDVAPIDRTCGTMPDRTWAYNHRETRIVQDWRGRDALLWSLAHGEMIAESRAESLTRP